MLVWQAIKMNLIFIKKMQVHDKALTQEPIHATLGHALADYQSASLSRIKKASKKKTVTICRFE